MTNYKFLNFIAQGLPTSSKKNGPKANSDFSIEYSKSSRATCRTCGEKIEKVSFKFM